MIELAGVTFHYSQKPGADPPALSDCTLSFAPGTRVALLGQNGSGKSTLARLVAGILKPRQGTIRVDGFDPTNGREIWEVRRRVGMVFQHPDDQLITNTLIDDVAFGPENLSLPRDVISARVHGAIHLLELEPFVQRPLNELPIGLKQRVAIAGVLAMRPQYMIFDEPTTMVPPQLATQLLATIDRLVAEEQIGIIYITHRMEEVAGFDRCVVLDGGRVALDDTPREVFGEIERIRALGLDAPLATELGRRLWSLGYPLPPTVLTDAELVDGLVSIAGTPIVAADDKGMVISAQAGQASVPADGESVYLTPNSISTSSTDETPLLETRELRHVHLRGTPFAQMGLDGATLTIPPGAFVAVVGPTRAGKSTLVDCLNAIIRPGQGMVFYHGKDVAVPGFDLEALRLAVGVVYQQPEAQIFKEIVGKDVAFGPMRQKVTLAESRQRVQESLEAVGLPYEEFRNRYTYALSGGQKRRVAIAGALAMHPRALILDEPTAGLDPRGRQEFLALVRRLHREQGLTIIYMTATLEDILDLATHVYVLADGKVALSGTVDTMLEHLAELEQLGVGLAGSSRLALAFRRHWPTFPMTAHDMGDLEAAIRRFADQPQTIRGASHD